MKFVMNVEVKKKKRIILTIFLKNSLKEDFKLIFKKKYLFSFYLKSGIQYKI